LQQKFFIVLLSILTTSLFISFQSADAATDYFLKIEGIDGESTDDKHKNEIEIESWSWGETNTGSISSGGGGGAGKASLQDISFGKSLDKSSPKLFLAVATGQHFTKAIFTARSSGENPQEYLKVTLENIMVTSYNIGGSSGDRPTDNVSLNFAKFTLEYTETKSDGTLGEKISKCWSVAGNQVCTSSGGGGGEPDPDSDGDGEPDDSDFCPADPAKTNPGICGCGIADSDSDADGIANCNDTCPLDPANDIDGDLVCGDVDNCPVDSNADQLDSDSDLSGNACDADDDNDGVLDGDDIASMNPFVCQDSDNDTCDDCSVGTDGFGPQPDNNPADDGPDNDVDGVCDAGDNDDDNDGLHDNVDVEPLTKSNAFSNSLLGGNEFGTVLSGFVIVTDVGSGEQISLAAAEDSQVSACDLAVLSLSSGDEVLVDCGSITVTVVSGSVTAEYTVGGETATVTLDEGESLTFDPDTASFSTGDDTTVTITIGDQTITIGANQTLTVHSVNVDIKPDDAQNVVNPQAKGVLTVAILSSAEFDATTVDPLSVKFGPNQATESHRRGHIEDVNRDGLKDMVLHFNIQDIGILENTTELELFGRTTDGDVIRGSDNIVLKGQKIKQN